MDEGLGEVLARVKMRILAEASRAGRCCSLDSVPEPGYDLVDAGELVELVRSCRVVVVMFYSPTCPYCRALTPVFLGLAEDYRGRAVFVRVNVYRHPRLAALYGISGVPTVLIFVGGRVVGGFAGLVDPEAFDSMVREALERGKCLKGAEAWEASL